MQNERRDEKGSEDLDRDEAGNVIYRNAAYKGGYNNPSNFYSAGAGETDAAAAAGKARRRQPGKTDMRASSEPPRPPPQPQAATNESYRSTATR